MWDQEIYQVGRKVTKTDEWQLFKLYQVAKLSPFVTRMLLTGYITFQLVQITYQPCVTQKWSQRALDYFKTCSYLHLFTLYKF